ncbi:MAG TPA: glycosyltransferase family 2 protein [Bacteroidia bacterium]|jgi:glycosyltransferase involved in cell wall biosynthesis|nr:glycosyltransferase family 2 protein [Bacteroidia bacterium]
MIPLSAVIITFNEEKNIARCLDSLIGIADDIVVVDSFSKDKTEEICKAKGARFIQHAFEGHIQQKNWAITQAKFPHILSLDADEALDETLKKSILQVKNDWTKEGYYMNRLTNYCGKWIKHCGWYPDKKLRLWDSRKGHWTGVNPHDKYKLFAGDKNTAHIKGDILHYSFYTIEQHLKQVDYFTDISSKALFEKGKKATALHLIINPVVKFLRDYIFKLGLLDGRYGFIVCKISAKATYLKYAKLKALQRKSGK